MPVTKLPNGATVIVCTRGRSKPKPCAHCKGPGGLLCDHVVAPGKTCDRSICIRCTYRPSAGVDLCREHAPQPEKGA